jgi:glutamate/tyrosine decarboxylase-like PLP-dependent enzyme
MTFQNPNAAYLAGGASSIPSPLNIGLENSRRFRALPVYAALLAYGRHGFAEIFARQVRLARGISEYLEASEHYELLPGQGSISHDKQNPALARSEKRNSDKTHIIVIFRAQDEKVNEELVKRINSTRKMYVSGTKWDGKPACRIAISTWRVEVDRDMKLVQEVLEECARS